MKEQKFNKRIKEIERNVAQLKEDFKLQSVKERAEEIEKIRRSINPITCTQNITVDSSGYRGKSWTNAVSLSISIGSPEENYKDWCILKERDYTDYQNYLVYVYGWRG